MNEKAHKKQIIKFGFYGLLKNLRFFEPYMIIFFTMSGLSLFHVGLLYSIREIIVYIFEIPSGVIADRYGKKTELYACFIFYIISFIIFFFGTSFFVFAIAMFFFALGEAFRSGTHKSMIMAYLDHEDMKDSKSKVYGTTRSYSLIGSTIMSLISIVFVLYLPEIKYLFLIAIIPYTLDLFLIMSYPQSLNERQDSNFNLKEFIKHNVESIKYAFSHWKVTGLLLNASSYQAGFKSIKDYIQPLIVSMALGVLVFDSFNQEEHSKIYIGVIYAVIYLVSAYASKQAHKVEKLGSPKKIVQFMWLLSGGLLIILSAFTESIFVVFIVFLFLYVFLNIRRPLMVERLGNAVEKDKRASMLSVEAQTTSLLVALFAPLIGYIADHSMSLLFTLVGIAMITIFFASSIFTKRQNA
ncbi:MAG: MFS transporter [Candidatus Izemoplasmataceae bacterium]